MDRNHGGPVPGARHSSQRSGSSDRPERRVRDGRQWMGREPGRPAPHYGDCAHRERLCANGHPPPVGRQRHRTVRRRERCDGNVARPQRNQATDPIWIRQH